MAKYDAIHGAGNVTVQAPPDFWTSMKQNFDEDYDRLVAAQERKKAEERYNSEKLEEQKRYNTQQEDLMFQQRYDTAVAAHQAAVADYTLASEQIGTENPEMQAKLNKQYSKEFRVPMRDGGYETRRVVPQSVIDYNKVQIKSKRDFDFTLSEWDDNNLTNEQKIVAWPKIKRLNRVFNEQLEPYEESYKRAQSYDDNKKLLDTMGDFLPAGYDTAGADGISKWTKAKGILLKDGEVSDAELKIIAADISSHIATREDAKKFWTDWNTNIMENMSKLGPEDATVIENLQRMQEIVLPELDKYYPGASGRFGAPKQVNEETYTKTANDVSQRLWGKNADEIDESQIPKLQEEIEKELSQPIQSGFVSPTKEEKPKKTKKKLHEVRRAGYLTRTGPSIEDPVTKSFGPPAGMGTRVKNSPFTYANKGIIPSDEWPGFKEVSIKEALQHYQKNKSKYKKDKKITVSQGLFRDRKDLTQYPK